MAMNKLVLNSTPQKITDGTKAGLVQGMGKRDFQCAESTTSPNKDSYILSSEVSFPVGATLWAWSFNTNPVTISVLTIG